MDSVMAFFDVGSFCKDYFIFTTPPPEAFGYFDAFKVLVTFPG